MTNIEFEKKTYRGMLVRGGVLRRSLTESRRFARQVLNRLTVGCTLSLLLSCCLTLVVTGAAGSADIPELPMADGSGDTPELIVDLVPVGAAAKPGKVKLSSLRGKVVLLDMFRSNCPHCEDHAPHIVELYKEYRQRGFTILGLATDDRNDQAAVKGLKSFLAKHKIGYPVAYVTTEVVAYYADPKNHGVPQMVLFGADGKMALRKIGWGQTYDQLFRKSIEEQLAKLPASKPSAKPAPTKPRK
jgi:thiol-disulfide isomerase/thioredoxin